MSEARHDLGIAQVLKAEAIGVPGKRTFRLVVEAEGGSAFIWVEKEQLSALALTLQRFVAELSEESAAAPSPPAAVAREPFFDFKAASLGLTYDEGREMFAVLAYEQEEAPKDRPTVACSFPRARAEGLADEALEVVASGRPVCPLCRQSMDPEGHACVRSNGHRSGTDEL